MVQELKIINYDLLVYHGPYVYMLKSNEFVKIGHSNNLCSRLETLKSSNPIQMDIISLFAGGKAEEAMLHDKFKQFHLRNEWFTYVEEIKQYCANFTPIPLDMARDKMAKQRSTRHIRPKFQYGTEGGT